MSRFCIRKFLAAIGIVVIFFTASANAQNDPWKDLDEIDRLALQLEQERLMAKLTGMPNFAAYFFAKLIPKMKENPAITFKELETRFRKFNTGLTLIAVPKGFVPDQYKGQSVCIYPIHPKSNEDKSRDFYIYLYSGDPARAQIWMGEAYGIRDAATNLRNLEQAGKLVICGSNI